MRPGSALGLHPRLDRPADDLQRRAAGARSSAPATRTRAARTSRARHLGHGQSALTSSDRLARPLPRHAARTDALAGWTRTQRDAARAARRSDVACRRFRTPRTYTFASPNVGARSARASGRRPGASPRTCPLDRPHLAFVNRSAQGGIRDARPRRRRSATYTPTVAVSEQRLRAGAAHRGRRDRARHRHEGVLGADRRLRHARGPGRGRRRRLRQPDGHARRRPAGVLQRHAQPGPAERHADPAFSEFGRRISENGSARHRPRRRRP